MSLKLNCKSLKYSDHAVLQMFRRNISIFEVKHTIQQGQIIKSYPEDKPYPSVLLLGIVEKKIIHVVLALNPKELECVIITAYIPQPDLWESDFKTKK